MLRILSSGRYSGSGREDQYLFDDMETSRALREKWKDLDDVAVTTSISGNAEFNAAGVDKGVGLAMLRTKLGIDRMHVIAFGDNENDLEMLEGAGIGVAMGNSKQYVKDAANEVTGDNDHDGVAEFLERFSGCKLCLIVIVDIRDREMYFSLSFYLHFW